MADKQTTVSRDLTVKERFRLTKFLTRWEMILVYLLILVNLMLAVSRPSLYMSEGTITAIIESGMDIGPIALGMILVMILGNIDISVASIMILASMVTGFMCEAGLPVPLCILAMLLVGCICGLVNGLMVTYAKMPSIIATLATQMFFRGLVEVILNTATLNTFPSFYAVAACEDIAGVPVSMLIFIVLSLLFFWILHVSDFGRKIYLVGNNPTTAFYSGISVNKVTIAVYVISGFMSAFASILFVGRMGGGISPSMGTGYEMNAIAVCVLGGVSPNGGKGKIYGPFIGTFIMTFLIYSLGLMGVEANTRKTVIGIILLVAVMIPNIRQYAKELKGVFREARHQ